MVDDLQQYNTDALVSYAKKYFISIEVNISNN